MSLNKIIIMGRMTRNPEIRYTQSQKPVASFTLAVDRDYNNGEKETDFIDCVAWSKTAEFVDQYFIKGQMAVVEGRLQSRDWTDREGGKRKAWEVVADRVYFGESKKKEEPTQSFTPATGPVNVGFQELNGPDGELPFD